MKVLLSLLSVLCAATSAVAQTAMPPTVAAGAQLVAVYENPRFFEGPSWDRAASKLLFTAFGKDASGKNNQQILRLEAPGRVSVWMDETQGINGTHVARNGRLLAAQAYGHKVLSIALGGDAARDVQTLSDGFNGQTYNQPNDIAEAPDGTIYYSDPDFKNKTGSAVFRLKNDGTVQRIVTHLKVPNGLEVSNDGQTLYVSDSFEKRVYAYPIAADGTIEPGKVKIFFDPATENLAEPDGMTSDENGNLYFAMRGGVWVVAPDGKNLGLIAVPEFCSNVTFGGADGKVLFLTCRNKVYSLAMSVRGAQFR